MGDSAWWLYHLSCGEGIRGMSLVTRCIVKHKHPCCCSVDTWLKDINNLFNLQQQIIGCEIAITIYSDLEHNLGFTVAICEFPSLYIIQSALTLRYPAAGPILAPRIWHHDGHSVTFVLWSWIFTCVHPFTFMPVIWIEHWLIMCDEDEPKNPTRNIQPFWLCIHSTIPVIFHHPSSYSCHQPRNAFQ